MKFTNEEIELAYKNLMELQDQIPDLKPILSTVMGVVLLNSEFHYVEFTKICSDYCKVCLKDIDNASALMN